MSSLPVVSSRGAGTGSAGVAVRTAESGGEHMRDDRHPARIGTMAAVKRAFLFIGVLGERYEYGCSRNGP